MINTLTLKTLIAKGACSAAQKTFAKVFPNGAPLTVETFLDVADQFDWECAARLLLSQRNQVKFKNTRSAACDNDDAEKTAAWAAYVILNAARYAYNSACDARDAKKTAAWAAYFTLNDARDAYNSACDTRATALVTYNAAYAARATALVTLNAARDAYNSACDARDAALVTYNAAYAAYAAARDAAFATGFATLYIQQESKKS